MSEQRPDWLDGYMHGILCVHRQLENYTHLRNFDSAQKAIDAVKKIVAHDLEGAADAWAKRCIPPPPSTHKIIDDGEVVGYVGQPASIANAWQSMTTAPRDGTNILLRFGADGASQGKFVPGSPYPWKFIDTNDGITWLVNHARDGVPGPTHWMAMPSADLHAAIAAKEKT